MRTPSDIFKSPDEISFAHKHLLSVLTNRSNASAVASQLKKDYIRVCTVTRLIEIKEKNNLNVVDSTLPVGAGPQQFRRAAMCPRRVTRHLRAAGRRKTSRSRAET